MNQPAGAAAIGAEMDRQHADAWASVAAARPVAAKVAASIRRTGRLSLLGMGGSHGVNRTVAAAYRRAGLEVAAEVLSEALLTPLPQAARTVLLVSQSGGTGELRPFLDRTDAGHELFGLTLDPGSALAARVPCLCGIGGPERAFAATRSITVSLALHLAVLEALGVPLGEALAELETPAPFLATAAAEAALGGADAFILSGRTDLQGVAECGALCLMELARCPALALEGGQLRHGPMEMLSRRVGVILLRQQGETAGLTPALAADCRAAGSPVVVLDASGEAPVADTVTLRFPPRKGLAAALAILPTLQRLLLALAAARIADVGTPLRSSKVTTAL